MILQLETLIEYGYLPLDLKPQSAKRILATCDKCGKVRETDKNSYHSLCGSCIKKGKYHSEETKALLSAILEGNTRALGCKHSNEANVQKSFLNKGNTYALGHIHTDIAKALISKNHADIKGDKNPHYNGGKTATHRRQAVKRGLLGYTLLMPLADGEEGHHVTNEFIMGIPADIHKKFAGGGRKKHRTKVLQWLKANNKRKYKMVLCILAKELSK